MIFWADCRKKHAFRKFYRFITNHNTNQYDKIAMAIAAIHIGITVLSRYPTPNVRKPPFSVYINPGFVIWTPVNNKIKNRMATLNLWFRRNSFIQFIEFGSCYILATKKLALVYSSHRNGLLIPSQWSTHPILGLLRNVLHPYNFRLNSRCYTPLHHRMRQCRRFLFPPSLSTPLAVHKFPWHVP